MLEGDAMWIIKSALYTNTDYMMQMTVGEMDSLSSDLQDLIFPKWILVRRNPWPIQTNYVAGGAIHHIQKQIPFFKRDKYLGPRK